MVYKVKSQIRLHNSSLQSIEKWKREPTFLGHLFRVVTSVNWWLNKIVRTRSNNASTLKSHFYLSRNQESVKFDRIDTQFKLDQIFLIKDLRWMLELSVRSSTDSPTQLFNMQVSFTDFNYFQNIKEIKCYTFDLKRSL